MPIIFDIIKDEDEYLEKISIGYHFNKNIVVNLTDFTDEELYELKINTEKIMWENYVSYLKGKNVFYSIKFPFDRLVKIWQSIGTFLFLKKIIIKAIMLIVKKDEKFPNFMVPDYSNVKTDYIYKPTDPVSRLKSSLNSSN